MSVLIRLEPLEPRDVPSAAGPTSPVLPFSDPAVLDHARAIVQRGEQQGRYTDVFLKAGDSNTYPHSLFPQSYLTPFGAPDYDPLVKGLLEPHSDLMDTWAAYHDWFGRVSLAADIGWKSADVLANLQREVAATNAGIALVMVGTNDIFAGVSVTEFRRNMTRIARTLSGLGVVPVLSTLPDINYSGGLYEAQLLTFNQVIAEVATQCRVPLWNLWKSTTRLPLHGLSLDGTHLGVSPNGGGSLWPADLSFGQNVRNLQALKILDWFREHVVGGRPTLITPQRHWQPLQTGTSYYAVGRDVGVSPTVDIYNALTGARLNRFLAFSPAFGGGVRVATGDVNADGFTDVVCAQGPGARGTVRIFSGKDGTLLAGFRPFGNASVGGTHVATGDLDGDGQAEIVVGSDTGAKVRIYQGGTFALTTSFRAFDGSRFRGVNVAVANVQGVGPLIAAATADSGGRVRFFAPDGTRHSTHKPYGAEAHFGLSVTAVDLDGDKYDELAVAPATAVKPIQVLDPNGSGVRATLSLGREFVGAFGLRLGTAQSTDGGPDTLLVGNGPGVSVTIQAFADLFDDGFTLPPHQANRAYGIFLG